MEAGQVVAKKYRLNRILGTGGMATVWAATNIFTERDFAIKMLLPQVATSQEAVDRFLQEAKVSARVDHPNIIDILDVERTEDGALFLVMELLTGVSLETALRRQSPTMTITELVFVMVEVARALAAAHRVGVVHRDLKPTNIYLHRERDGKPTPKVLDFGVSKFYEEGRSKVHALTVDGTVLGSPMYMSPEQARGESKVDGRSDIFSFGAILFEALAGFRAYDAPNFNALIVKIATKPPRNIDEDAPQVPMALRNVVKKCLEPNYSDRYPTFDEVAEALMDALPELERSDALRLPPPASGYLHADPEATNALPVIRPSDRPPVLPPMRASTPSGTGYVSGGHPAKPPWQNPSVWLTGGGVAVGVVLLSLLVMFAMRGMQNGQHEPRPHREPQTPALAAPQVAPPTPPTPPTAVPVPQNSIAVDSLPRVEQPTSRPRTGTLGVTSQPVPCILSIDGQRRGQTPLPNLELPVGGHHLTCVTATGKTQELSVTVIDGGTDRHVFRF